MLMQLNISRPVLREFKKCKRGKRPGLILQSYDAQDRIICLPEVEFRFDNNFATIIRMNCYKIYKSNKLSKNKVFAFRMSMGADKNIDTFDIETTVYEVLFVAINRWKYAFIPPLITIFETGIVDEFVKDVMDYVITEHDIQYGEYIRSIDANLNSSSLKTNGSILNADILSAYRDGDFRLFNRNDTSVPTIDMLNGSQPLSRINIVSFEAEIKKGPDIHEFPSYNINIEIKTMYKLMIIDLSDRIKFNTGDSDVFKVKSVIKTAIHEQILHLLHENSIPDLDCLDNEFNKIAIDSFIDRIIDESYE